MSPLAKIFGILGAIATVIGAADHTALSAIFGATGYTVVLSICSIVTLLSHSLFGSGPALPGTPSASVSAK